MSLQLLELLPVWVVFACACLIAAISLEIGTWLGQRQQCRESAGSDASIGVIVGSILALWAFLFAFTFNMAASRYEQRRVTVLEDANAIGTVYMASALLPEPLSTKTKDLLRQYVALRIKATQPDTKHDDIVQYLATTEAIQSELWSMAMRAAGQDNSATTAFYIRSLDSLNGIYSRRINLGLRGSIPLAIWIALVAVGALGLASAGYQAGIRPPRRTFLTLVLVMDFAVVLTIIADLDNPRAGLLVSSQAPIDDLARSMGAK